MDDTESGERGPDYNSLMPAKEVCAGSIPYCVLSTEPFFDAKQVYIGFTSSAFRNENKSPRHARMG